MQDSAVANSDALLDLLLRLIISPTSGSNTAPVLSSQQSDDPPPSSAHYAQPGSAPRISRTEAMPVLRTTYSDWSYGDSVLSGPLIPRTVYIQTRYLVEEPVWAVDAVPIFDPAWGSRKNISRLLEMQDARHFILFGEGLTTAVTTL
jgi:hypothetical protein